MDDDLLCWACEKRIAANDSPACWDNKINQFLCFDCFQGAKLRYSWWGRTKTEIDMFHESLDTDGPMIKLPDKFAGRCLCGGVRTPSVCDPPEKSRREDVPSRLFFSQKVTCEDCGEYLFIKWSIPKPIETDARGIDPQEKVIITGSRCATCPHSEDELCYGTEFCQGENDHRCSTCSRTLRPPTLDEAVDQARQEGSWPKSPMYQHAKTFRTYCLGCMPDDDEALGIDPNHIGGDWTESFKDFPSPEELEESFRAKGDVDVSDNREGGAEQPPKTDAHVMDPQLNLREAIHEIPPTPCGPAQDKSVDIEVEKESEGTHDDPLATVLGSGRLKLFIVPELEFNKNPVSTSEELRDLIHGLPKDAEIAAYNFNHVGGEKLLWIRHKSFAIVKHSTKVYLAWDDMREMFYPGIGGTKALPGGERMKMFIIPACEMERFPGYKKHQFYSISVRHIHSLPKNAENKGALYNSQIDSYTFRFRHDSFPLTPGREHFPVVNLLWNELLAQFTPLVDYEPLPMEIRARKLIAEWGSKYVHAVFAETKAEKKYKEAIARVGVLKKTNDELMKDAYSQAFQIGKYDEVKAENERLKAKIAELRVKEPGTLVFDLAENRTREWAQCYDAVVERGCLLWRMCEGFVRNRDIAWNVREQYRNAHGAAMCEIECLKEEMCFMEEEIIKARKPADVMTPDIMTFPYDAAIERGCRLWEECEELTQQIDRHKRHIAHMDVVASVISGHVKELHSSLFWARKTIENPSKRTHR